MSLGTGTEMRWEGEFGGAKSYSLRGLNPDFPADCRVAARMNGPYYPVFSAVFAPLHPPRLPRCFPVRSRDSRAARTFHRSSQDPSFSTQLAYSQQSMTTPHPAHEKGVLSSPRRLSLKTTY